MAGALARRPGKGGHSWVFLNWILGLRRLGCDVLFLDSLEQAAARDDTGEPCPVAESVNWRYLQDTMNAFGLEGCFSLRDPDQDTWLGRSPESVVAFARSTDVLFNVMGYLDDPDLLGDIPLRVFVDIDPGFPQMWQELGLVDMFSGYDRYVTVGQNIGSGDCRVPTCGLEWLTIRPPVVLELWPASRPPSPSRFTSVCTWRGAFAPVDFGERTYGLRVHEFRGVAGLPEITGCRFEIALDIDPADGRDRSDLVDRGWRIVDPEVVARDPASYQEYVQGSAAEFMVAKQMYVSAKSGWMSDRSACYLASGRPVIAQDTGWTEHYSPEAGLLGYTTVEEAAARVRDVSASPGRHAAAARSVAEDLFDSDVVLGDLLGTLGVG